MSTKDIVMYVAIAAAVYYAYQYNQCTGTWY